MTFPADIKGCMKDCILPLFWPRTDIVGFFEKHGCTKAEVASVALEGENALKRHEIVNALFTALAARSDDGHLTFRDMIDRKEKAAQTKGLIYVHPISGAEKKS